ncbi:MAG: hypothetical protein KHX34_04610 [Clostridiales bacterium]|jgi:lmo1115 protein|nr:hypothetical protein [Clostridiales bacterium]
MTCFTKRFVFLGLCAILFFGLIAILMLPMAARAVTISDAATVTLNVTNTPVRGDVLLEKTGMQLVRFEDEQDAYGNTVMRPVFQNGYLAGAVFELRAAEDIVGKEGSVFYRKDELIETLTTSKTGSVKSKVLPLGKYSLTEISAPDGYVLDATPHPFTLAAVDQQTALVEVKVSAGNTYLPVRVTLRKQKENLLLTETADGMIHQTVETVPGEGFVFGLFNRDVIAYGDSQKLPANTLMATGATDSQGNLTFSGLYPHGDYYIKELSVPDGWLLSAQTYPVTLTPDHKASGENVITVYLDQPILNRLIYTPVTLTKTDITGEEKLPGALIEVYDAEGNIIYREYTDANGEIPDIPVVPGTYTFKETYAPSGYALNTAIKTFTVTADGQVHGDTVIRDEVNRVTLKKIRQNGEALAGAVFGLFDSEGTKVQEATSDADGSVVFQQIPYGRYAIRELSAPYGYHPSAQTWEVTVDGTYQNPIGLLDTVVNEDAPGRIRILKQDELDQHVIAGVRFDIYSVDEAGNAADCVAQMTTNEQGIAESPDLFPADYIVMEHAAPTGYEETLWSEKITVGMDELVSRTVTNRPIQGVLRIVKTDSETAKGLPGAQFTITRISGLPSHNGEGDGEVVAVITTDENGIAQTPWLTWGEYEVTETVVPDDYLDGGYSVIVRIPEQTGEEAPPKAK